MPPPDIQPVVAGTTHVAGVINASDLPAAICPGLALVKAAPQVG